MGMYVKFLCLVLPKNLNLLSGTCCIIDNFSQYLRNPAILRTTSLIAELRTKKSCGTAIADLQNLISAILRSLGQFR